MSSPSQYTPTKHPPLLTVRVRVRFGSYWAVRCGAQEKGGAAQYSTVFFL